MLGICPGACAPERQLQPTGHLLSSKVANAIAYMLTFQLQELEIGTLVMSFRQVIGAPCRM